MTDGKPTRRTWSLPEVVDPEGRKCVIVEVPSDPTHIAAFWGNLWSLTRWYNWQRDAEKTGKEVAEVWRQIWHDARESFETCIEAPEVGVTDAPCVCIEISQEWASVVATLLEHGLRSCVWCGDTSDKERGISGIEAIVEALTVGNCGRRLKSLVLGANGELIATWEEDGEETEETIGSFMSRQNPPETLLENNDPQYACFAITELRDHLVELYNWYVDEMEDDVIAGFEVAQFLVDWTEKIFTLGIDVGGIEATIEEAEAFAASNFESLRDEVNNPYWQERVRCELFCAIADNDYTFTEDIYNAWVATSLHFDNPPLLNLVDFDHWVENNFNWNYCAHRLIMSLADETEENECFDCSCDEYTHTWVGYSELSEWGITVGALLAADENPARIVNAYTMPEGDIVGKPRYYWLEIAIDAPFATSVKSVKVYMVAHTLDYTTTSEDHAVGIGTNAEITVDRNTNLYPSYEWADINQAGNRVGIQIMCGALIIPGNNDGYAGLWKIEVTGQGSDPWA